MITHLKTQYGEYEITLHPTTYAEGNNLAIQMMCWDEEWESEEPFAMLTVNLDGKRRPNEAFVDVNNCPWAMRFIEEYELGEWNGEMRSSGFCIYPLVKFNMDRVNKFINRDDDLFEEV